MPIKREPDVKAIYKTRSISANILPPNLKSLNWNNLVNLKYYIMNQIIGFWHTLFLNARCIDLDIIDAYFKLNRLGKI